MPSIRNVCRTHLRLNKFSSGISLQYELKYALSACWLFDASVLLELQLRKITARATIFMVESWSSCAARNSMLIARREEASNIAHELLRLEHFADVH